MYKIALSKEAVKYYKKVSSNTAARLDRCFTNLESEPIIGSSIKPLKGIPEKYRYRIGDLRVIYEVDSTKKSST